MIVTKSAVEAAVDALRKEMEEGFVTLTQDLVKGQEEVDALKEENKLLKKALVVRKTENERLAKQLKAIRTALGKVGLNKDLLKSLARQ